MNRRTPKKPEKFENRYCIGELLSLNSVSTAIWISVHTLITFWISFNAHSRLCLFTICWFRNPSSSHNVSCTSLWWRRQLCVPYKGDAHQAVPFTVLISKTTSVSTETDSRISILILRTALTFFYNLCVKCSCAWLLQTYSNAHAIQSVVFFTFLSAIDI